MTCQVGSAAVLQKIKMGIVQSIGTEELHNLAQIL